MSHPAAHDIVMHGTLAVGPYLGYYGQAEYDHDAKQFHGRITETKDVISFVGANPSEIAKAFKESVDDYLEFCKSRGESPDKPFSGKFLVRVSPKLHHDLAVNADRTGQSLNQYVTCILESKVMLTGEQPEAQFKMDLSEFIGSGAMVPNAAVWATAPLHSQAVPFKGEWGEYGDFPATHLRHQVPPVIRTRAVG